MWMKHTLPAQHVLYFGIKSKKRKIDAAGMSPGGNQNVAEILNQITMKLAHEIVDPETNRRVLVDLALIVAGGEVTKRHETGSVTSWTPRNAIAMRS
jgi:hypothetical protein